MGCDIHAMKESKERSWWRYEGEPDIGRNYDLYAVLAGVRNYDGIKPIVEPRGVDENSSQEFRNLHDVYGSVGDAASWVTLKEMKEFDQGQEVDDETHCVRGEDGKEKSALDELITELEEVREKRGLTDNDVRLSFFFDD